MLPSDNSSLLATIQKSTAIDPPGIVTVTNSGVNSTPLLKITSTSHVVGRFRKTLIRKRSPSVTMSSTTKSSTSAPPITGVFVGVGSGVSVAGAVGSGVSVLSGVGVDVCSNVGGGVYVEVGAMGGVRVKVAVGGTDVLVDVGAPGSVAVVFGVAAGGGVKVGVAS